MNLLSRAVDAYARFGATADAGRAACVSPNLARLGRYHRPMPDSEVVRAGSKTAYGVETTGRKVSRWAAPVALLVAVVAVGLTIWALVIQSSNNAAETAALNGDPKARVCAAFDTVSKAVPLQTNDDLGRDPVAQAAVAANARLALFGGGQYLLDSLDPATPAELAEPVRSFASTLQDVGMNALAGLSNRDQVIRLAEGEQTRSQIVDLCK